MQITTARSLGESARCSVVHGPCQMQGQKSVLSKATQQLRETCRHWGWKARLAWGSVCSPKKGGDKYRHRITQKQPGKTGSEPQLQPGPVSPSPACPLVPAARPAPPPVRAPHLETKPWGSPPSLHWRGRPDTQA